MTSASAVTELATGPVIVLSYGVEVEDVVEEEEEEEEEDVGDGGHQLHVKGGHDHETEDVGAEVTLMTAADVAVHVIGREAVHVTEREAEVPPAGLGVDLASQEVYLLIGKRTPAIKADPRIERVALAANQGLAPSQGPSQEAIQGLRNQGQRTMPGTSSMVKAQKMTGTMTEVEVTIIMMIVELEAAVRTDVFKTKFLTLCLIFNNCYICFFFF